MATRQPDAVRRARPSAVGAPHIIIYGGEVKWLTALFGDGYLGYAHLDAKNAEYLADAIETIHSFGGWQLHDNYFGPPGGINADDRQDRHGPVPGGVQLRTALPLPTGVLG